nr:hypothetical protein [uncultured Carboxylicivirga sp.]
MKKLSYIFSLGLVCLSVSMSAQNLDDAIRFNKRELTGTARSMGMANAFGALGGDLSAISINPAGIAVYRSSEFAFTPSFSFNQSKASFGDFTNKDDAHSFPFNQIGGVSTYQTLREKKQGVISTHFGFTYNRTADFNSKSHTILGNNVKDIYDANGKLTRGTLVTNMLLDANGHTTESMSNRAYYAYDTYLIDAIFDGSTEYFSHYENIIDNGDGTSTIVNRNTRGVNQNFLIDQSGYSGEYGLTFGANISNKILLGGSVNFQSFKYEERMSFIEVNTNGFDPSYNTDLDYYDAYTKLRQDGFGINAKVGLIANLHPLKIGLSFHTPTFYNIDEEYYDGINAYYLDKENFYSQNDIGTYTYNYRTPYRAQGSLALVLGKIALVSVDYEMTDNASSKISSSDRYVSDFDLLNKEIRNSLKLSHDVKAGIEVKPVPFFALRAGAAYYDSPYKDGITDVKLDKWMFTGGLGFRNRNFFFDAAYAMTKYDDSIYLNAYDMFYGVTDDIIKMSNTRHHSSFTFGWKF